MKTFDEATRTIFPDLEENTIEQFVLLRGRDLMKDLTDNPEMRQVLSRLCAAALSHLMSGCGCDPVSIMLDLSKESCAVGTAVGMEMEKDETHITTSE